MLRLSLIAALSLILTLSVAGQSTGLPGFNDYTVSLLGSGTTSCTSFFLLSGLHTFDVNCPLGATVDYFINIVPCAPSSIAGCQGSTIDLALSPFPIYVTTLIGGIGGTSLPVFLPTGLFFSTQCIVSNFGCIPWFTQAYNITT